MYVQRHLAGAVLKRAKAKGAVVVTGARQVGKTTLIETIRPDIPKISFDDRQTRLRALENPSTFFDLTPPPVFLDEVQYMTDIFPYIKIFLDRTRRKGAFFMTGSQRYELMQNVSESLAGRVGILELMGLSLREIKAESWNTPFLPTLDYLKARTAGGCAPMTPPDVWQTLHRGGFPELVTDRDMDWADFYADYTRTYIERDVRNLAQVADADSFFTFMTVCAAMTGQLLNLASLARDVGISQPTAKRWLSVLKTSGLVYLLQPYSNNIITRTVKTPKLHFLDTGLAAYLTRWTTPGNLSVGAMKGAFFESFVVAEILKSYVNAGKDPQLFFIRDDNKKEIDLLVFENNTLHPIEIKARSDVGPEDIKHFNMLDAVRGVRVGSGGVICLAKQTLPLGDKHFVIPVHAV